MGRKQRLPFVELFDVSNLEDDGSLVKTGSKRDAMGRVSACIRCPTSRSTPHVSPSTSGAVSLC